MDSFSLGETCPCPRPLLRVTATKPGTAARRGRGDLFFMGSGRWADGATFARCQPGAQAEAEAGAGSTATSPTLRRVRPCDGLTEIVALD